MAIGIWHFVRRCVELDQGVGSLVSARRVGRYDVNLYERVACRAGLQVPEMDLVPMAWEGIALQSPILGGAVSEGFGAFSGTIIHLLTHVVVDIGIPIAKVAAFGAVGLFLLRGFSMVRR